MQAEVVTVKLGELYLGIRTNEPAVTEHLKRLLSPHLAPGVSAPPNLSLAIGEVEGSTRGVHLLYRSAARELRTASMGRLLRSVPLQLEGYAAPPPGAVRVNARALVGPDDVVLVDRRFDQYLERVEPRLTRHGYRRADSPFSTVDAATGDLLVAPARLAFDVEASAALDREHPLDRREVDLTERALPVRTLLAVAPASAPEIFESPGACILALAPMVADRDRRMDPAGLGLMARWLMEDRVDLRYLVTEADLLAVVTG